MREHRVSMASPLVRTQDNVRVSRCENTTGGFTVSECVDDVSNTQWTQKCKHKRHLKSLDEKAVSHT